MGIDYGSAKIGLAVTDPDRMMAFGRGVLRPKSQERALEEIAKMIIEEKVVKVVIGLPLDAEGKDTLQTPKIRSFGQELAKQTEQLGMTVEMEFIDESFSTYEAGKVLREIGATSEQKKATEDEIAAIILLHRYIDFRP